MMVGLKMIRGWDENAYCKYHKRLISMVKFYERGCWSCVHLKLKIQGE